MRTRWRAMTALVYTMLFVQQLAILNYTFILFILFTNGTRYEKTQ